MPGKVRALILDVDGVLTDGGIILDDQGRDAKRFHARDGVGVKLALAAGWRVLFLTARASASARQRASEMGAEWAIGVGRKDRFLDRWLEEGGIGWAETAYVGDDLPDLRCLRKVGWPIAVADACREVREAARYVTAVPGGAGAVRDAVEWLLDRAGIRDGIVEAFANRDAGFSVGREEAGGPEAKP